MEEITYEKLEREGKCLYQSEDGRKFYELNGQRYLYTPSGEIIKHDINNK